MYVYNILLRVHIYKHRTFYEKILYVPDTTYQNFIWRGAGILYQNMYDYDIYICDHILPKKLIHFI